MAAIVAVAATDNWNANGSWVGGVQPTAADDVTIVAGATVTIPSGVTALARSVTVAASGALAFAATTSVLTIGDASGGAFTNSGTITLTAIGTINFVSTSNNGGTGWGLTTGGQTMPNITVNGVGNKTVLQDALTATGATITLTAGTLDTNSKSVTAGTLASSNSNVRSLVLGTSSITVTGTGNAWNIATATNFTLSAASSTITISGNAAMQASPTAAGSYGTVLFTGSGTPVVSGAAATFVNLTRTGTAAKTDTIQFVFNTVVTSTLTLNSNSSVNRLLVQSNVPGTARTITAAAVVMTNVVDFMDITGAGAATWTAAATGATFLGDAGGNSGITFTTPATQTHTASAGGNWSDVTKWTSRVPLPQDNVIVDVNTTGTLTADMPRLGADLTFTGFAGTYTSAGVSIFGSLTLSSGMTATFSSFVTFAGRGTHTITSAGKTIATGPTFQGPGGSYTLQDAFTATQQLNVTDGTFTTSNQSVTCLSFAAASGRACTVNLGTSTLTITSAAAATVWNTNAATTTLNGSSATVTISTASANIRTVILRNVGTGIGTITYTVAASTGILALSTSAALTISIIGTLNVGSNRGLQLLSGATFPITNFNVNGTAGNIVAITASTPGTAATISKVVGTPAMMIDYVSIQDLTATGGLWVDGPHYTNVSGNTGWTFADAIPSDTDTGAGSDVDSPISITDTDTGTSSDVDGGIGATLSDTDTGSGADAESLAAAMTDTDTATAVDAESNAAAINDTDTGTANDLEVGVSISDTDTGVGADNEALSLSDTEVGSGTDLDLGIAITDDETATTVDLGTIAAAVDDIEAGNSLDTESLTALIADLETAFGDDDGLIAAAVGSSDTGVGVDAESVFKTADPVVIEPTSATLVTQGTTSGALLTEATAGALLT